MQNKGNFSYLIKSTHFLPPPLLFVKWREGNELVTIYRALSASSARSRSVTAIVSFFQKKINKQNEGDGGLPPSAYVSDP